MLFLGQHVDKLVVLDEIHRLPALFEALRGIIDAGRRSGRRTGRFLILGSASIDLLRQSGETLAGRIEYVDSGTDRYPKGNGIEAIGLRALAEELRNLG